MATDMRRTFHHRLDEVHEDLVRLAAMVLEFIGRGTEALLTLDLSAARALIDDDDQIDKLALAVEERCYLLLATQQPMAVDLRTIVCAIRLTSEIERAGDLMVNVAKGTLRLPGMDYEPAIRGLIQQMSDAATKLFRQALDAYIDGDAGKAEALDGLDDELDEFHGRYIARIIEASRAGTLDVQAAVQLALIGRYYERIGDHAVNIGERIRYMVTGLLPGEQH
jgi:phosphate transport system protein